MSCTVSTAYIYGIHDLSECRCSFIYNLKNKIEIWPEVGHISHAIYSDFAMMDLSVESLSEKVQLQRQHTSHFSFFTLCFDLTLVQAIHKYFYHRK